MKRYIIAGLLLLFSVTGFAQVDFCAQTQKAIKAAANNFSGYSNFQYNTVGGQKAYLADFSYVSGESGYIYYDAAKNKTDFFQKITSDKTQYNDIYKSIESCLVNDENYWTKYDNDAGTTVIFSCNKTGSEVSLVSSDKGVTIVIQRSKQKDLPVFTSSFCTTLKYITGEISNNFKNITGEYKDSSILGKAYKSTQQLNQRGTVANITVGKSWLKPGTMDYSYSEMVAGYEMTPGEVTAYFDQCLTAADGWVKGKPSYGDGITYTKGDMQVTLSTSKSFNYKEADNSHISIKKKADF